MDEARRGASNIAKLPNLLVAKQKDYKLKRYERRPHL